MSDEQAGDGGLQPRYREYRRQKCMLGYTEHADWADDVLSACQAVLAEFELELDYARKHFEPGVPLRQKALELIANARCGIYDLSSWKDRDGLWRLPRNVLIELGMAIALNRPTVLLRRASKEAPPLPECLHNLSVLEFGGETTLRRELPKHLRQWADRAPEQDWWNRYCHFGERVCAYREAHPRAQQWGRAALHCHISDGPDGDRLDFRGVIEEVLDRFADVSFGYHDELQPDAEYRFLLCGHCQAVRSAPFAIYRISPETPAETYIAIGISLALEEQFGYPIPRVLLTDDAGQIPSLLAGYEVIVARSDRERRRELNKALPAVLQKVRATAWAPRLLPFIELARPLAEPEPEPAEAAPAVSAEELARRAEELYASLSPEEQAATKQLLLRMIRLDMGSEIAFIDTGRVNLHQGSDPERVDRVLDKLIEAGLMLVSGDTLERQVIQLADTALVRSWSRLREWIENPREKDQRLEVLRARLRELDERQVRQGLNMPPDLIVEMEQIEREIATLEPVAQAAYPIDQQVNQEEIDNLQKLLEAYRRTLHHYLLQRARLGMEYIPPAIPSGILEARAEIGRIKQKLHAWGIEVDDHPDDEDPARQPLALRNRKASQDEIDGQKELLAAYRRRLLDTLTQQAQVGAAHVPPAIPYGIADAREQIRRIKQILRAWGVAIEDRLDDEVAADWRSGPRPGIVMDQQEIEQQMQLLQIHRRRLTDLLRQLAATGLRLAPPAIIFDIGETRENIQRIKYLLRVYGVDVDDHPNDEDPDDTKTSQPWYIYDAFISYADNDYDWVENTLVPHLEQAGLRLCLPYRDFAIGRSRLMNIEDAVRNSRRTLMIMTPDWVTSEWQMFDSLLIQNSDPRGQFRRMLPIILRDCELPARLAILTPLDMTDLNRFERQMQRLIGAIQAD